MLAAETDKDKVNEKAPKSNSSFFRAIKLFQQQIHLI
jgi:hypothetical protein